MNTEYKLSGKSGNIFIFRILYGKQPNYRSGEDSVKDILNNFCKK